jgi:hypothetical protein
VLKSIQGAQNVAMMTNIRYVLVGVAEHDQLPDVLGSEWKDSYERKLERRVLDYYRDVWAPIVQLLQTLLSDLQGEVCPALSYFVLVILWILMSSSCWLVWRSTSSCLPAVPGSTFAKRFV